MSDVNNKVKNYIVLINTTAYYLFWTSKVAHLPSTKDPRGASQQKFHTSNTERERHRETERERRGIIKEIPDGIILRKVFSSPGKYPQKLFIVYTRWNSPPKKFNSFRGEPKAYFVIKRIHNFLMLSSIQILGLLIFCTRNHNSLFCRIQSQLIERIFEVENIILFGNEFMPGNHEDDQRVRAAFMMCSKLHYYIFTERY